MKKEEKAAAFDAICRKLDKPINKDVVLNDIDSLIKMEDIATEKQKELDNKTAEVQSLGIQIQKLEGDKKDIQDKLNVTQEHLDKSQKEIITLGINITSLTTEVEQLKADKPLSGYSKWELFKKLIGF